MFANCKLFLHVTWSLTFNSSAAEHSEPHCLDGSERTDIFWLQVQLASCLPLLPVICILFRRVSALGCGARLETLLSWHLVRQLRKRILLFQLFPAAAFDKDLYSPACPSTLPQPPPRPPTCQWISNYWPSWGRIFGWLYLMWQQQVRWSGPPSRLWSVTVPEEKGNLNWCWGPVAPLFIFHIDSGLVIPLNSERRLCKGSL